MRRLFFSFTVLLLVCPAGAWATDHGHVAAVTFSPLHLAFDSTGEITAEYALQRKLGVAVIGGYGHPTATSTDEFGNEEEVPLTLIEAGASARYYVFGSFDHGMQLGAEVLYIHLSGTFDDVEATASATSISPFIGYKKAARFGLTFDAQLGARYTLIRAKAKDSEGNAFEADDDDVGVLLNLNLGWSF